MFQSRYLNFSQICPSTEMAKLRLSKVLEDKSPLEKLERDITVIWTDISKKSVWPVRRTVGP